MGNVSMEEGGGSRHQVRRHPLNGVRGMPYAASGNLYLLHSLNGSSSTPVSPLFFSAQQRALSFVRRVAGHSSSSRSGSSSRDPTFVRLLLQDRGKSG